MKKKYPFLKTMVRVCREAIRADKLLLFIFIFYTFFASIYPLFSIYLPKFLLNEIIKESPDINYLIKVTLMFGIGMLVFGFFQEFLRHLGTPRIMLIRVDHMTKLFRKLSLIEYKFTEDPNYLNEHDSVFDACSGSSRGLEPTMLTLFKMFASIVTIIFYIIIVSKLSVLVLLAILVSVIIGTITTILSSKIWYKNKEKTADAGRRLKYYEDVTYDFSYGKDIRLYSLQDKIKYNHTKEIKNYISIIRRIRKKEFLLALIDLFFVLISDSFLYYILITKVVNGMPIDEFSMYLIASLALSSLIKATANNLTNLVDNGRYINDYYHYMADDKKEEKNKLKRIENDTLEIVFEDVSFKYPNTDKWIFENLNLKISKKEKLAIVGVNGAGKTTLIKLLLRLFEPTSGRILVNGIDIREFDVEEYYKMFSVVFQDINILAYTVRENIALGLEVDDERIWDSLERVGLKEKVQSLDKGLDHMMLRIIDENGAIFSGGENQKLAIARALYKNGNMVILDEPTAALDALAESEIYQKFNDLVKEKTAIYVSHRLASTKFCDKIALFKDTKLLEYGTHDELMALKQEYYNMFVVQGKYYQGEEV